MGCTTTAHTETSSRRDEIVPCPVSGHGDTYLGKSSHILQTGHWLKVTLIRPASNRTEISLIGGPRQGKPHESLINPQTRTVLEKIVMCPGTVEGHGERAPKKFTVSFVPFLRELEPVTQSSRLLSPIGRQ